MTAMSKYLTYSVHRPIQFGHNPIGIWLLIRFQLHRVDLMMNWILKSPIRPSLAFTRMALSVSHKMLFTLSSFVDTPTHPTTHTLSLSHTLPPPHKYSRTSGTEEETMAGRVLWHAILRSVRSTWVRWTKTKMKKKPHLIVLADGLLKVICQQRSSISLSLFSFFTISLYR